MDLPSPDNSLPAASNVGYCEDPVEIPHEHGLVCFEKRGTDAVEPTVAVEDARGLASIVQALKPKIC